ncbi:MAG TPA: macro domain-containing protein [Bryobacterales bacterium]|nr:macro domain-containing protein [Bryobacterales bacterium]
MNCVGVMGRGIALQFRKAFPENFKAYKAACDRKALRVGSMFVYDLNRCINPRVVINFPTKRHWKGKSRIEDIESGLEALVQEVTNRGIRSIAIPPLGCGLGGLDWSEVRPRIEESFSNLGNVRVLLFEPAGAPEPEKMVKDRSAPRMTAGRASLLALIHRYLSGVMDPVISLLEIHKLMYLLQESGEDLRLRFQKAQFGPYAENLRHVLSRMEGYFILGHGEGEDRPDKQIDVLPGAWEEAERFLEGHPDTRKRLDQVAAVIDGFETPYGMELLTTVHWVANREQAAGVDAAIARTYAWNDRKRMFTPEQIRTAWTSLHEQGWLR